MYKLFVILLVTAVAFGEEGKQAGHVTPAPMTNVSTQKQQVVTPINPVQRQRVFNNRTRADLPTCPSEARLTYCRRAISVVESGLCKPEKKSTTSVKPTQRQQKPAPVLVIRKQPLFKPSNQQTPRNVLPVKPQPHETSSQAFVAKPTNTEAIPAKAPIVQQTSSRSVVPTIAPVQNPKPAPITSWSIADDNTKQSVSPNNPGNQNTQSQRNDKGLLLEESPVVKGPEPSRVSTELQNFKDKAAGGSSPTNQPSAEPTHDLFNPKQNANKPASAVTSGQVSDKPLQQNAQAPVSNTAPQTQAVPATSDLSKATGHPVGQKSFPTPSFPARNPSETITQHTEANKEAVSQQPQPFSFVRRRVATPSRNHQQVVVSSKNEGHENEPRRVVSGQEGGIRGANSGGISPYRQQQTVIRRQEGSPVKPNLS